MCAVARCPNKLGSSPYRFCLEHLPADYRARAERYIKVGDPRKERLNPCSKVRVHAREAVSRLLRERIECDRGTIRRRIKQISNNAVNKAIEDLIADNQIKRIKIGVYRWLS